MARLYFKESYAQPILEGDKRATFRERPPGFKVGDVVTACTRRRGHFARLRIIGADEVLTEEITDEWAEEDGFDSADDLRERLAKTYPNTELVWRIRFELALGD